MSYLEKNIEVLNKHFPYIVKMIKGREEEDEKQKIYWDEDLKGNEILAVERNGYLWYLNSRYDAKKMVQQWCEKHKRNNFFEPEIVFGLGIGDYLREQRKNNPKNPILVYEPNLEVFLELIRRKDMTEVFDDDRLYLAVGKEGIFAMTFWMSNVINLSNYEYIDFCALPGYMSIYPYEYLLYKRTFMETLETLMLKKNTLSSHSKDAVINEFSNICDCVQKSTVANLVYEMQEKKKEMPDTAFLISAGPSLDKNIEDLKLIQGRAFIMAVDTAIRPLLQAGVKPDMFATVDPEKDIFLFEQEGVENIPLILSINVRKGVSQIHTGKHFYMINKGDYVLKYLKQYNKDCACGGAGGSVATSAFYFLQKMGFKTIVLVGQDLAYPGNRSHAKAAYDDMVNPENKIGYFMVEDIYGGEVLTRVDMNNYRRWFETAIENQKDLHVIDATEGGAKIKGTEILTLKEAIQRQCKKEYDIAGILQSVEPTFTDEEQCAIREDLQGLPEQIDETVKALQIGKKKYERLDELNRKGKYQTNEFKRIYEEISEFNEWLHIDSVVDMLSCLAKKEEFKLLETAYEVKQSVYEDIRDIARQGISMVDAYIGKADELKECVGYMKGDM